MSDSLEDRIEELEAEVVELYETVEERDRVITELEAGGGGGGRGGGGRGDRDRGGSSANDDDVEKLQDDRNKLAADLEKYRDELMASKDMIAEMQSQVSSAKVDNSGLLQDKLTLQSTVESQKKLLDTNKRKLLSLSKESDAVSLFLVSLSNRLPYKQSNNAFVVIFL
jgi:DNA repair exonuclease SbcCD ATPase subunit